METASREIRDGEVLFDPAALERLLDEEPHPRRAMCRFPRRLEQEIRRGNAWASPGDLPIRIEAGKPEGTWREETAAPLRVPSGRLVAAAAEHPDTSASFEPAREWARVEPGLYRLRVLQRTLSDSGERRQTSEGESPAPEKNRGRVLDRVWAPAYLGLFVVVILGFLGGSTIPLIDWKVPVVPAFQWVFVIVLVYVCVREIRSWLTRNDRDRQQDQEEEVPPPREAERQETGPDRMATLERIGDLPPVGDPAS